MTAAALFAELRAHGVRLAAEGNRLKLRGSEEILTPELIQELRARKEELLEVVRASSPAVRDSLPGCVEPDRWPVTEAELLSMPLEVFARSGAVVRVWSSVLEERLILAADNAHVDPGECRVVYWAGELRELAGLSPEGLKQVHRVKKLFRGRILPA